jgi:hypothetical protein
VIHFSNLAFACGKDAWLLFRLKSELATAWSGNAEINNTVACKKPSDDRLHGQILPNQ